MSLEDLLSSIFGDDEDEDGDLDEELEFDDEDAVDLFGDDDEDDDELDEDEIEDYEIGGGVESSCPHCGEPMEVFVDPAGGAMQEFVEDCSVCCRPSAVHVTVDKDGVSAVELEPLD